MIVIKKNSKKEIDDLKLFLERMKYIYFIIIDYSLEKLNIDNNIKKIRYIETFLTNNA